MMHIISVIDKSLD